VIEVVEAPSPFVGGGGDSKKRRWLVRDDDPPSVVVVRRHTHPFTAGSTENIVEDPILILCHYFCGNNRAVTPLPAVVVAVAVVVARETCRVRLVSLVAPFVRVWGHPFAKHLPERWRSLRSSRIGH